MTQSITRHRLRVAVASLPLLRLSVITYAAIPARFDVGPAWIDFFAPPRRAAAFVHTPGRYTFTQRRILRWLTVGNRLV